MRSNPLAADLDLVLARTGDLWEAVRGQRLFLTGGTGFFGCWLLEAFVCANDAYRLEAHVFVLTRDPPAFARKAPHLAGHPAVHLVSGDARSFEFPAGTFSNVIHAAIDYQSPVLLFDHAIEATRRTLDFAVAARAKRYLFTSSGAVYGPQPPALSHVTEDYPCPPTVASAASAYGDAKRVGERLCAAYREEHGLEAVVARGFAFVGPYLPLHLGSAIGNFIGDALQDRPIEVHGDGTPVRSYLYGADLAVWLWTILLRGEPGRVYNVGSDVAWAIQDVAKLVAEIVNPRVPVQIALPPPANRLPPRYVPSIERPRSELGLRPWHDLRAAIKKTADWHKANAL